MKLHFYGADRCVTGSCHCLEINGKTHPGGLRLTAGARRAGQPPCSPSAPGDIDILLVTHAHIDHTGRIPLLVKHGFHRPHPDHTPDSRSDEASCCSTPLTFRRATPSTANRKGRARGPRARSSRSTPPRTRWTSSSYVTDLRVYSQSVDLCEGVSAVFTDAGHLLGSASITLELHGGRRAQDDRLLRRYRQRRPAHHPRPAAFEEGGLCGDGVHLRRPQPHRGVELHRRAGGDHRRDARQGRQRRHPVVRRGPHAGAFVLHP